MSIQVLQPVRRATATLVDIALVSVGIGHCTAACSSCSANFSLNKQRRHANDELARPSHMRQQQHVGLSLSADSLLSLSQVACRNASCGARWAPVCYRRSRSRCDIGDGADQRPVCPPGQVGSAWPLAGAGRIARSSSPPSVSTGKHEWLQPLDGAVSDQDDDVVVVVALDRCAVKRPKEESEEAPSSTFGLLPLPVTIKLILSPAGRQMVLQANRWPDIGRTIDRPSEHPIGSSDQLSGRWRGPRERQCPPETLPRWNIPPLKGIYLSPLPLYRSNGWPLPRCLFARVVSVHRTEKTNRSGVRA